MPRPANGTSHTGRPDGPVVDNVKELVENALDNKDIAPLVRVVFSGAVNSGEVLGTDGGVGRLLRDLGQSQPNGTGSVDDQATPTNTASEVLAALTSVMDEQTSEISQICRTNAEEIARSMLEVGTMSGEAEELRAGLVEADEGLQGAGAQYLRRLQELQDMRRTQSAMAATRQVFGEATKLVGLCCDAAELISNGQLYRAHQLLSRIRSEHIHEWEVSAEKARAEGVVISTGEEGILSGLGQLQTFLVNAVDDLTAYMLQRATSDFNDWLVRVRAEARDIGGRAIRRAAAEKDLEEAAAAQRASLVASMSGKQPNLADAVDLLVQRKAEARDGGGANLVEQQAHIDPLDGLDMSPLHRCLQVHKALGRENVFLDYYRSNRRQQLASDLNPPANFSDSYQPFISQVVGFFMVEDRVQRGAAGLAAGAALDAGWESAVATLKAPLDAAFQALSSATALLALKDFVSLACSALGKCGYHVAPMQEILAAGRLKYFDLVGTRLAAEVAEAIHSDQQTLAPVEVDSPEAAIELGEDLGLPILRAGGMPQQYPMAAPFSHAVPGIVRALHRYVEETAAYLTGVVSAGELLTAVRGARDAAIRRIVADALQVALDTGRAGAEALRRTAQHTANLASLVAAAPALDEFTVLRSRGVSASAGGGLSSGRRGAGGPPLTLARSSATATAAGGVAGWSGAAAGLAPVQEGGERHIIALITGEVNAAVSRAKVQDWQPEQPPRSAAGLSTWTDGLISYMQGVFSRLLPMLPEEAGERIVRTVLHCCTSNIMGLLMEDNGVHEYNLFAIFRLHADIAGLQRYADSIVGYPGLRDELAEAAQFCELLVTGSMDDAGDPARRKARFPQLQPARLAAALSRYREVDSHTFSLGHQHPRMPRELLKRKFVDGTIKKLRAEDKAAKSSDSQ